MKKKHANNRVINVLIFVVLCVINLLLTQLKVDVMLSVYVSTGGDSQHH